MRAAHDCQSRHAGTIVRLIPILVAAWMSAGGGMISAENDTAGRADLFESSIRPLLIEHCVRCHGAEKQEGGLRLDTRDAVMNGGDGGPIIIADEPDSSRLIQAVRYVDLEMPPDGQLAPQQIDALTAWVRSGAKWPANTAPLVAPNAAAASRHWAFQPLTGPEPPQPQIADWRRTPIDQFILSRLEQCSLEPSPEADRRTLIRRLTYTLTGLPPTPGEVEAFVRDDASDSYEQLVDRLLDSTHYGEHWGRHWLDVARYSDTKGYVYAREERFWIHAPTYRDWVVQALNNDLPYDRFLLLQLAADQVPDRQPDDLAAMGFLTLGRRFLGVERDIIDDRIDVVCRGAMGLTVSCARCHDHKYDPIPTADYYALYGVFDSCREQPLRLSNEETQPTPEALAELQKRQDALTAELQNVRSEWSDRIRSRVVDYLTAQTELQKYPPKGFDQIFSTDDTLPAFVRRWESYLIAAKRRNDPVFTAWHAYAGLASENFAAEADRVTRELQSAPDQVNSLVAAKFPEAPTSFADVIQRYAALLTHVDAEWRALIAQREAAGEAEPTGLPDPAAEQLRGVLYGPEAPCEVPHESIVEIESHMDSSACERLWKLQGEVDRWVIQSMPQDHWAVSLVDRPSPHEPRIFRRGNPATPGDEVPRQFLKVLSGSDRVPFEQGSGRLELAQAIIDPANPLTARVIVNRVWMHHFGEGLVATPSDFGLRADPPSHPELLDWLTTRFIHDGWSLKSLHRLILTSAVYRQSSRGPADAAVLNRALAQDPGNRLLWRMNSHRLTFEEFRDALLAASGELDLTLGGRPSNLFQPPYPTRRTLYGLVDRQYFPNVLRVFDFANPDLHIPQRLETTVPQQALFVLNHPFVLERARRMADETPASSDDVSRVSQLYRQVYQRAPTDDEVTASLTFLKSNATPEQTPHSPTADDWQYAYGRYDEEALRVADVVVLPHFNGNAWQGGPSWPDAALGWVQLTAKGGHPGNDRAHASVRRWKAPRDMTVQITSQLIHEPAAGDGIRAFIVSSRQGLLASEHVHQSTRDIQLEDLVVEAGETIDFVVDIGDVLNSDQYLWSARLTETSSTESPTIWNSEADFPADTVSRLTPWEQLAQVLLGSNEFLFID